MTILEQLERMRPEAAEAAPGVAAIDVEAVNSKADRSLYAKWQKIHPKRAKGTFRTLKWALMAICLGIYYALPWLNYDRGPDLPSQAVLLDLPNRRFFFFGLEVWPQEFYYITGLLVIAALSLFLITAVAGRVWCGYFCPQTVWTDLMIAVERFWQGDRNARIRLDREPWGAVKILRKVMTHLSWLAIAVSTGGALIFYFADPPTLLRELIAGEASVFAYTFLALFTFTTYLLGGIAREQVCIYMCPWPRIQGAMVDHESLLVSYRDFRGEPRGPVRKSGSWESRGDCIDCKACVAVCPMGIDIRDGSQLECIQCALCIDACNEIMDKIGRPKNLIAYETIAGQEAAAKGERAPVRIVRARTLLYLGLIAIAGTIMLWALMGRTVLEVNVLADRNPLFVKLSDGSIRNGFSVKILNKLHEPRSFRLGVEGLTGARLAVSGFEGQDVPEIEVRTDTLREVHAFVAVRPEDAAQLASQTTPFHFVVTDGASGATTLRTATFRSPGGTKP